MKQLLLIPIILISIHSLQAQHIIAVQNNSSATFYTSLDSAIIHAVDGDTIYLPGGIFNINTQISKRIHIIGVGHNPDSTIATNYSQITAGSSINIVSGADGGSISGVNVCGYLVFGTSPSNQNISNYTIRRCNLDYLFLGNQSPSSASHNIISENIIDLLIGAFSQSNIIVNNLIGMAENLDYCTIKNNIFFGGFQTCIGVGGSGPSIDSVSNSVLENNIFIYGYSDGSVTGSVFNNNLFCQNVNITIGGNIGSNNLLNQTQSSIFNNQSGLRFNYAHNYHLQATCPGKNTGTDGNDIGIYGDVTPWKDGSIPTNPHVQFKNISGATNSNGNLPVHIIVGAQDH